jgi:hypothetical protein
LLAGGCGPSASNNAGTAGSGGGGGAGGSGGSGGTTVGLGGFGGAGRGGSGGSGGAGGSARGGSGGSATGGTGGTPRPCAHEIDNPSCWSARDLTGVTDLAQRFEGAIFDGRYITIINGTTAPPVAQVRYDTQGDFIGTGPWDAFYPAYATFGMGWQGGTFDGRYVYLAPNLAYLSSGQDVAARYDTQAASFSSSASWLSFNLSTAGGAVDATIPGYAGAAFDGRYVYFAPKAKGMVMGTTAIYVPSGKVARYDTQATFNAAASWSYFDLAGVDPAAAGFGGVVFDDRYLYFVPTAMMNARVARYDTQASFTAAASWSTFETTSLNPHAGGFRGGVFDGRHVYFVPTSGEGSSIYRCIFTRYDTQASFTAAASWAVVDGATIYNEVSSAMTFSGAATDGRYVYMIPDSGAPLLRFDPQAPFDAKSSWTAVDLIDVADTLPRFSSAAFDGRYLYLFPGGSSDALRFDARDAGPLPSAIKGGSFY